MTDYIVTLRAGGISGYYVRMDREGRPRPVLTTDIRLAARLPGETAVTLCVNLEWRGYQPTLSHVGRETRQEPTP